MVSSAASAALLLALAACGAGLGRDPLRQRQQRVCGSGQYGSLTGVPQQLVVTHLTPGVADWNIAVPMPPMCKNARVTGVDTTVCDADEPPAVRMLGLVAARVHRPGQLRGYATVNVTVFCVPPPLHAETRSTYELLSNELISNEVMSNELISDEVPSDEASLGGLTSDELMPKLGTLAPSAVTTSVIEMTPPTPTPTPHMEVMPPAETTSAPASIDVPLAKEAAAQSYKVTIKIKPPSSSKQQGQPLSYKVTLPTVPLKGNWDETVWSRPPTVATPPRIAEMPPTPRPPPGPLYGLLPPPYVVSPLVNSVRWLRPQLGLWPRQRSIFFFRPF